MGSERGRTILVAGVAVMAAGVILLVTLVVGLSQDIPFGWFTRDPALTLEGHPLTGVQSHLGVLALWASGVVTLFVWGVTRGQLAARAGSFLLATGLLSLFLAIDDLFMVHDDLFSRASGGLSERWMYGAYFALGLVYAWWYRRILFHRENRLMLLGVGLMLASVLVDLRQSYLESMIGQWRIFIEDGFKLLGIALWTAALVL